ncbi:MAG: hypothetical protein COA86_06105 [Kangiella sp.]|nr:MAG: hypothetical protein COA86_06105 [Kangiella sp.]
MKPLTPRELQVIQWIANGKTAWEISKIIGISERTVYFHLNNCKRKLEASTKTQAAVNALRQGIIE